jgi:hypothetical protein
MEVDIAVDTDAKVIAATYVIVSDPCDCTCSLTADWTLADVPSGTWTISESDRSVCCEVAD